MKQLLLPIIWLFTSSACSSGSDDAPTPDGITTFKYEVFATRPWHGLYTAQDGGDVQVTNQPLYWTYTGSTNRKIFAIKVIMQSMPPIDSPNNMVCKFYVNDSIVRNDTFTLSSINPGWSTLYFVQP